MSAKICKITALEPMEGYDNLQLACILGWKVAVKKNEFKVGDLVIYFAIGSILPNKDETAFLEGKRLKTKKFKDYISQGLVGPLSWLKNQDVTEDMDVSEALGVEKFIPEEEKQIYEGQGKWPMFIPKTDEDRAQNCIHRLKKKAQVKHYEEVAANGKWIDTETGAETFPSVEEREQIPIVITQKYDGTSTTFFYNSGHWGICSRNRELLGPEKGTSHFFEMAKKYNIQEKMVQLDKNIAIQGETVGPKINGNRMKLDKVDFAVFNIYDIDRGEYMLWEKVEEISSQFGLKTVKVVYRGDLTENHLSIEYLLKLADSQRYESDAPCEGIVLKTNTNGFRFSCKVISNAYILKYGL